MILKQLVHLLALARERHFGRAAASVHVTQPGLSASIRHLEDELGVPIVERGHHFIGFTPEGQCLLDHAKRIQAEVEALQQNLDQMRRGLTGRLRLGAVPTALPVVSLLTSRFCGLHPQVRISVLSLTSTEIQARLDNFDIEAGITYLDNEPLERVRARPLYKETYVLLVPDAPEWAGRTRITWAEAARTPLCLLTPDMQNRRIVDGVFRSVGAAPEPSVETNSIFNLCSHVAAGPWCSVVPRPLLRFFGLPRGARVLDLEEPQVHRTMGLIVPDREPMSPLARRLFDMVMIQDLEAELRAPLRFEPDPQV